MEEPSVLGAGSGVIRVRVRHWLALLLLLFRISPERWPWIWTHVVVVPGVKVHWYTPKSFVEVNGKRYPVPPKP